jgi:hypothetical protein
MHAPAPRLKPALTATLTVLGVAILAPAAQAAITANVAFGQLNVTGDDADNTILVRWDAGAGKYVASSPGGIAPGAPANGEASSYCVQGASAQEIVCDRRPSVDGFLVRIDGLGGADTLAAGYGTSPWRPVENNRVDGSRLDGGPGNDLIGGSPGPDALYGGPGDDGLDGAAGNDSVVGGTDTNAVIVPGSDRLFGGPGSDDLFDGDGDGSAGPDQIDGGVCPISVTPCSGAGTEGANDQDFVLYDRRTTAVVVSLTQEAGNGQTGENDTLRNLEGTFTGTGADTLTGNARTNGMFAGGGNDTINVAGDAGRADTAGCGAGADTVTKDADDIATDCETMTGGNPGGGGDPGGGTGGGGTGGGTTGGGTTGGGTTGGGTTGGGTPPPAADTTGPTIVVPGSDSALTAAKNGSFAFGLGPFTEDTTGTVAIRSVPVSAAGARATTKKVVLNLGTKAFTAKAGQKVPVRFTLSAKNRKILAKRKKIRMTATIVARDKAGNATTKKVPFTLKAPKRKH